MSGPVTRSRARKPDVLQLEPSTPANKEPTTSTPKPDKLAPACSSKASTVSQNKTDQNKTVRSKTSSIRKREAELERAQRLADVERTLIEKEYELTLARLSASGSRCSGSSLNSLSRVQEWLTTELHANEQDEPACHPPSNPNEHAQNLDRDLRCEAPNAKRTCSDPKPSDIQLLAREIANSRRPTETKDLPYFNGNVSEWLSFKAAVKDVRASSTDNEIISKFRRCLKGEARTTVAALLDTHVPVSEIMEALELRFGLPELILQEEIQALKDLLRLVDNTEQLSKFACKVRNCVSTIKALNKPEHLYNVELLRTLKQKIPHLKARWLSYALEHEHENEPELVKLSAFLKREAQTMSKYWLHEPSRTITKPIHSSRTHYTKFDDDDLDPEPYSNPLKESSQINCVHPSTSTSPEATLEPVSEKLPHGTTACGRSARTRVLLKIRPIKIRGPLACKGTYALLDGGSTLTLLKKELAEEIGLNGISEPLTISGVNSTSEEPDWERVDLEIVGPPDAPLELSLSPLGARTVKRLLLAPQIVADIGVYKRFQDLPRTGLCYDHAVPELLIGQDSWHAIISKEIRHGNRNEYPASPTTLGWVVQAFSNYSAAFRGGL